MEYIVAINDRSNLVSDEVRGVIIAALKGAVDGIGDGTELVEVRFFKEYGKFNLTAYIWKAEGISLNDCENVHNIVSAVLDTLENLFDGEYILNVSSSGLDRRIVSYDDFRRAMGTEIEVFCEDKSKTHGVLNCRDEQNIEITLCGSAAQKKIIPLKNITKVQPYVRF